MDLGLMMGYVVAFLALYSTVFLLLVFIRHHGEFCRKPAPGGPPPSVSVIIPAYNEGAYIRECIESVLAVDYPAGKLDIIVVDDGSTDGTLPAAREFEGRGVRVFTKKNGGKAAALNFGIRRARGEIVATMDADSYLTPGVVRELVPHFRDPEVMAATPAIRIQKSDSALKEFQRLEYLMTVFARRILGFIDSVPVTPGPFSMFRRSVFGKVGLFDETSITEDVEMALRLQAADMRIRSSHTAEVYTEPPDNIPDLIRQRVRWQRGGVHSLLRHRRLLSPRYGDFGLFFVPLAAFSFLSFLAMLLLSVQGALFQPYYVKYMWLDSLALEAGSGSLWVLVLAAFAGFSWVAMKSIPSESFRLRHIAAFFIFYGYLSLGYNLLTLYKELRGEEFRW